MNVLGNTTALQVLRGKIRGLNALKVDRTLSIEGASADAKATGAAIAEVKNRISNVDNTSDMEKPVSTAQASAIAAVNKTANEALETAKSNFGWYLGGVKLESTKWEGLTQHVEFPHVAPFEVDQPIFISPSIGAGQRENFKKFDIHISSHEHHELIFGCSEVPDVDVFVDVVLFTVPETT